MKVEKVPDLEWWDEFFVPPSIESDSKTEDATDSKKPTEKKKPKFQGQLDDKDIYLERVTHYVQHPVPLKNE